MVSLCDVMVCVPYWCVAMYKCVWHLRVRVGRWVTAVDTVLECVMLLVCNCVVMRIGSVCDYTEMGEVSV